MDPRVGPPNPFARTLSQPDARDSRNPPVPPPPFMLQAPVRQSQTTLLHDPFLPRRIQVEDPRQGGSKILAQGPLGVGSYTSSFPREVLGNAARLPEGNQVMKDTAGSWRLGDQRGGHTSRTMQGTFGTSLAS